MKGIRKFIRTLGETVLEIDRGIVYRLSEHVEDICFLFRVAVMVALVNSYSSITEIIICAFLVELFIEIAKRTSYKLKAMNREGMPISSHRYTYRDSDGVVSVEEKDAQDALLYLCDVEDYLRRKGLL